MAADIGPLIDGISKLIGVTDEAGTAAAEKGIPEVAKPKPRATPGSAVVSGTAEAQIPRGPAEARHTSLDVEQWLSTSLKSDPVRQTRVVHDYLRGSAALEEAASTGATHVRDISVPVWESAQKHLQEQVDSDPEVQQALRQLYAGKQKPPSDVSSQ